MSATPELRPSGASGLAILVAGMYRLVIIVVGWLLLATPAAAWASSRFRVVSRKATGPIVTDGRRWVAWPAGQGRTEVFDDRSGQLRAFAAPSGCDGFFFPTALGGGRIGGYCAPNGLAVLDVRTGRMTRRFPDRPIDSTSLRITGIGRHWLEEAFYDRSVTLGYQARVGDAQRDDPLSARVVADLDSPKLLRHLCSPLHRRAPQLDPTGYDYRPFYPYTYEPPFGLTLTGPSGVRQDLILERCGRPSRRLATADPTTRYLENVQLSEGLVTWTRAEIRSLGADTTDLLVALDPRTGRRTTYRVRGHGRLYALHTHRRLVSEYLHDSAAPYDGLVLAAPRP